MKTTLKPGAELDLLTQQELRSELRAVAEMFVSGFLRPPQPIRKEDGLVVAGGGPDPLLLALPRVQRGMEEVITRVIVDSPGSAFTPAAPYQAAGAYLGLYRNNELLDFVSLVAGAANGGGIPYVWTFGESQALRYRDGEALCVAIGTPPAAGTALVVRAEGYLAPLAPASLVGGEILPPT